MSRPIPIQAHHILVQGPVLVGGGPNGRLTELNLDPNLPDYVTTDGVGVWIERPAKGSRSCQATRFVDVDNNQHGPVHKNFAPAIVWALNEGWRSPKGPDWLNDEGIAEVRAGGCPEGPFPWPDEPLGVETVHITGDRL